MYCVSVAAQSRFLKDIVGIAADLPSTHASVLQSIRQLEDFRLAKTPPNKRLQLTNTQLQEVLVREYGNASKFEQEVLGWPVPPSMQHGNLKHRAAGM